MKGTKMEMSQQTKITLISVAVATALVILGLLSGDIGVFSNTIIIGTFIIIVPLFMISYEKFRGVREYEEKFPIFLRDIIESLRSGVPFHKAISTASKIDYGKFSREVKKMANQISWGMPLNRVLDLFMETIKSSKKMSLAMRTIKETYVSGGDVVATLESVADSIRILADSEKERRSLLNQYVVLIYAICFLFIGIVAAINKLMVPLFTSTAETTAGLMVLSNPCMGSDDPLCSLISFVANVFSINPESIGAYYTSLFFMMSMIEAACCGLVAGQISENSVVAGVKHSIIMSVISFAAFGIMVRLKLLGV
jgi:flagellar protein FlaJ